MALPCGSAGTSCTGLAANRTIDTFLEIANTMTAGAPNVATRGFSIVGIGAAQYRRFEVSLAATLPECSRTIARSLDGFFYHLDTGPTIEVDQFGAIGDDEADDYEAIQFAIAFWQKTGGILAFSPGRRYFVGAWFGSMNRIFVIDHLRDAVIDGRGAVLRSHSMSQHAKTFLFTLRDFQNIKIQSLQATDSGTDINVEWRGLYFVTPDANLGDCHGLILDRVTVSDAVAFLYVAGALPQRVKKIRIMRSSAIRCYYGMVFAENGDDVRADLDTINCRRSYFAYGVSNHEITVKVRHNEGAVGAESCILIKRYIFDTKNIQVSAIFHGSVKEFSNLVKLEHQPDRVESPSRISDISIMLNLDDVSSGLERCVGIGFSSYEGTNLQKGYTANLWDGITIAGDLNLVAHPIVAYSRPSTEVLIDLIGDAASIAPSLPKPFQFKRHPLKSAQSNKEI